MKILSKLNCLLLAILFLTAVACGTTKETTEAVEEPTEEVSAMDSVTLEVDSTSVAPDSTSMDVEDSTSVE